LFNAPHDLASGRDLDHPVTVAATDQRIAILQPKSRKDLSTMPFGAVARRASATGKIKRAAPDDVAVAVVFANRAIPFVADEIVSVLQLASQPRVAMRLRMLNVKRYLLDDLPSAIDLDDPPVAAFCDHGQAVREPLERMNLDATGIRWLRLAFVLPDDLLDRRDLHDLCWARVEQHVTIFQTRDV